MEFQNRPLGRSRFRFYWETYDHPALNELRRREGLDQVVSGAGSEIEVFTRIMKWAHEQFAPGQPDPYPPWNALIILDWIRSGKTKGFCAQYAQVMAQALLSLGHQARYASLANHEVLEVWSNQYAKWITMDPADGIYYTRGDGPLNSYELYLAHEEARGDEVSAIGAESAVDRLRSYGVFSIATRNDHLSQNRPPSEYLSDMWQERVHLITRHTKSLPYHEGKLRPITPFVSDLYFPMNTAHVKLLHPHPSGRVAISLETDMPGFDGFQASMDQGEFRPVPSVYLWQIRPGHNEIRLVARNTRGVTGPVTKIVIEKAEKN